MAQHEYGELPDHLTETDVERMARESDTLFEFQRQARVSRRRAKEIIRVYRLKGYVGTTADAVEGGDLDVEKLTKLPW